MMVLTTSALLPHHQVLKVLGSPVVHKKMQTTLGG